MVEKMSDVETTTENIKDLETKIGVSVMCVCSCVMCV